MLPCMPHAVVLTSFALTQLVSCVSPFSCSSEALGINLDPQFVRDLTVLIAASAAAGVLMGCLGQPAINGYFLAGSLVGPGGFKLIKEIVQVILSTTRLCSLLCSVDNSVGPCSRSLAAAALQQQPAILVAGVCVGAFVGGQPPGTRSCCEAARMCCCSLERFKLPLTKRIFVFHFPSAGAISGAAGRAPPALYPWPGVLAHQAAGRAQRGPLWRPVAGACAGSQAGG